jgi:hypothetical protein
MELRADPADERGKCALGAPRIHGELLRETVESALDSSRRMANMSLKAADDAAKHRLKISKGVPLSPAFLPW